MQTFKSLEEVENACLAPAVENVVISCVQNLMDAYGEEIDADEVGGVGGKWGRASKLPRSSLIVAS